MHLQEGRHCKKVRVLPCLFCREVLPWPILLTRNIQRIHEGKKIGPNVKRMEVSYAYFHKCCHAEIDLLLEQLCTWSKEIKYSNSRELRAQLQEIAPMNSEGSKLFCPNGPSANVSPLMENKCGGKAILLCVYTWTLVTYHVDLT